MFKVILTRLGQGHRTIKYPSAPPPEMPERFRGLPVFNRGNCPDGCGVCIDACPTGAVFKKEKMHIDLGKCLFCTDCVNACSKNGISFSRNYRLSVRARRDLLISEDRVDISLAEEMGSDLKRLFGRSLKLRQVSAGGCNACEADVNVLNTIGWDLGRFGIKFVASPRHADGLLITGPVTKNMELALKKTYDAVPDPKIIIASGACAISGGPYAGHKEVCNGVDSIVPVDLYIPGCPPHPLTVLDGVLRFIGRLNDID